MRFFYFIVTIFDFLSAAVGINKWSKPFSILASIFDKSNLLNLIPFADNVILLKSKCYLCGQDAPFSKRIVSDDKEILVGNNNYQPCCRKCL